MKERLSIPGEEKERLVSGVREVCEAYAIYLLGIERKERKRESLFAPDIFCYTSPSHYYLLVLTRGEKETHEVQERIESHAQKTVPLTAIVLRKEEFRNWLSCRHPFAEQVAAGAPLLYGEAEERERVQTGETQGEKREMERRFFNREMERVGSYVAGADLYRTRKEWGMSVFMLHAAGECLLRTSVEVMTGYCCHSHNLDKLMRYAQLVLPEVGEIFGRKHQKGEALFKLLQRAYIEARYRDGYNMSGESAETLREVILRLREHVREVWVNRLTELT